MTQQQKKFAAVGIVAATNVAGVTSVVIGSPSQGDHER